MEKAVYNPIMDRISNYIGILTVLDYETSVRKCLSSILVDTQNRIERKVIVDLALKVGVNKYRFVAYDITDDGKILLALKVGVNKYRFVAYDITDDGKILWNSGKYVTPCEDIVKLANSLIRQKSDILANSMLCRSDQAFLQKSCAKSPLLQVWDEQHAFFFCGTSCLLSVLFD